MGITVSRLGPKRRTSTDIESLYIGYEQVYFEIPIMRSPKCKRLDRVRKASKRFDPDEHAVMCRNRAIHP